MQIQQHEFRQETQSDRALAVAQASTNAEAFYRDFVAASKSATPTRNLMITLSQRYAVAAGSPAVRNGSIVLTFEAQQGYAEPNLFGGSHGTVQLSYTVSVPMAPATVPAPALRQATCPNRTQRPAVQRRP